MRRPKRYPRPVKPLQPEDMLNFGGLQGLTWGKPNLIDFWLVGIASVETEGTSDGKVGWIQDDKDGVWEQALNQAALSMIRMYCLVAVDLPDQEVCDIALRSLLRSVTTFKFSDFTPTRKAVLLCNSLCMPHSIKGLEPHQYESVPTATFPSPLMSVESWEEEGPSSPQEHIGIRSSSDIKNQILPLEGRFRAASEAKDLAFTKGHAQDLSATMRDIQFPPAPHRLDSFRAPPYSADITSEIGSLYGRLPFGGKCVMHRQMVEAEMQRLSILIGKAADRREDLKKELAFVVSAEQRRARCIATLREVKESNAGIKKDITSRMAALDAPEHDEYDEEMTRTTTSSTAVRPVTGPSAPGTLNPVEDNDLDAEALDYANALVNSSRDF